MSSKGGKKKRVKRMPAIVPRFLKGVATIGAIPTLAAACEKGPPHVQPVVAQYSAPVVANYATPPVVAAFAPDAQQPSAPADAQPRPIAVVAAYVNRPPIVRDAGVTRKKSSNIDAGAQAVAPPPPPPVVAAYAPPDPGPAVVAAYVPHPTPPIQKPKTKK